MTYHRRLIPVVLAVACMLLTAAPAVAGTTSKPYTASVTTTPSTLSGGQRATLRVRLTNQADQQQLGSANVTVPSQLTIVPDSVSIPWGTVTVVGSLVQLRSIALAPGTALDVTLLVDVPCAAPSTTPTWTFVAKQANNFSGTGNDFYLTNGPVTTTWTGGCRLRFRPQPQDARVGERISGLDFVPAGSSPPPPPVAVEAVDGNNNVITSASGTVAVALGPSSGGGSLRGTLTATFDDGIATFDHLTVNAPGTYRLAASTPGYTSTTSDPFQVQTVAVLCPLGQSCATPDVPSAPTNPTSAVQVTASPGPQTFLTVSWNSAPQIDCAGYTELVADHASILAPNRDKVAVLRLSKAIMNAQPDNGAASQEVCFGYPTPFATAPGFALTRADIDGDGDLDYIGVLGDCGTPPCVSKRSKNKAGDGIMEIRMPASAQDPMIRR